MNCRFQRLDRINSDGDNERARPSAFDTRRDDHQQGISFEFGACLRVHLIGVWLKTWLLSHYFSHKKETSISNTKVAISRTHIKNLSASLWHTWINLCSSVSRNRDKTIQAFFSAKCSGRGHLLKIPKKLVLATWKLDLEFFSFGNDV